MESNEAPDKVYLLFNRPYLVDYTKLNKRRCDEEVEYTRTDAFIKNACEFLFDNYHGEKLSLRMIENFRKYLKGE